MASLRAVVVFALGLLVTAQHAAVLEFEDASGSSCSLSFKSGELSTDCNLHTSLMTDTAGLATKAELNTLSGKFDALEAKVDSYIAANPPPAPTMAPTTGKPTPSPTPRMCNRGHAGPSCECPKASEGQRPGCRCSAEGTCSAVCMNGIWISEHNGCRPWGR